MSRIGPENWHTVDTTLYNFRTLGIRSFHRDRLDFHIQSQELVFSAEILEAVVKWRKTNLLKGEILLWQRHVMLRAPKCSISQPPTVELGLLTSSSRQDAHGSDMRHRSSSSLPCHSDTKVLC